MDPFLIDTNYINFAWGYQNHGHLITSTGEIREYRISDNKNNTLKNKLQQGQLIKTIPPREVDQLYQLLLQSRNSIASEKIRGAYDAGSTSYIGYIFKNRNVEKIELFQSGDFSRENLKPAGQKFIREIQQIISSI